MVTSPIEATTAVFNRWISASLVAIGFSRRTE